MDPIEVENVVIKQCTECGLVMPINVMTGEEMQTCLDRHDDSDSRNDGA